MSNEMQKDYTESHERKHQRTVELEHEQSRIEAREKQSRRITYGIWVV